MALPTGKKPLILVNLAAFIGLLALNGLSNVKSPLFPRSIGNVSSEYPTEITPSGATFAIWGFIYAFQTAWIIYSLTLLCRKDAPDILPVAFYVFFIISCICNIVWVIVWVREQFGLALGLLFGTVVSLAGSVTTSSIGLHKYLQKQQKPVEVDVWCTRILIQNGIIFYNAWVTIATCINVVVSLHYQLGVNASTAATTALSILLVVIVIWFSLENFVLQDYTRLIFAEYIVLLVGLTGVIKAHWTGGGGNQSFVLIILIIAALLFIARIALIIQQEKKKPRICMQKEVTMSQIEINSPQIEVTVP